MTCEIHLQEVAPQIMVSARGQANHKNVSEVIGVLLTQVWEFIRANEISNRGLNVALYWSNAENPGSFFTDDGVAIGCGVLLDAPIERSNGVQCTTVPGGKVATTKHIGAYQKLPGAHAAIHRWCGENGHALAGPNWEIYGHMGDNPDEVETDVFYLLA